MSVADWETFDSQVIYEVDGTVTATIPDNVSVTPIGHRESGTSIDPQGPQRLSQVEKLHANIVNVDGWFDPDRFFDSPNKIQLGDETSFYPDYNTIRVYLDAPVDELLTAAKARATEDATHAGYVLGDWAYRAKQADHFRGASAFRRAFHYAKMELDGFPQDATCGNRGGER